MSTTRPTIRKYTLVVEGDTTDDFDQALAEATRLLNEGNYAGRNSNDSGAFYFDSTDVVHDSERPAR